MQAPCFNCPDRWINLEASTSCHATCKKYLDFTVSNEQVRQIRNKELSKVSYSIDYGVGRSSRPSRRCKRYKKTIDG